VSQSERSINYKIHDLVVFESRANYSDSGIACDPNLCFSVLFEIKNKTHILNHVYFDNEIMYIVI